jgi:putative cell wall-binding protein
LRERIRRTVTIALSTALVLSLLSILPAAAVVAPMKVVIIVGPTGSLTDRYRSSGDDIAATAEAAGAVVQKVYSPNATWANVRSAVEGANVVVYLGHGNGYPNPYGSTELTDRANGWGLNRTTANGDGDNWSSTMVYCGEQALLGTLSPASSAQWDYCGGSTGTQGIHPAPGFVMVFKSACYAPGAGETRGASEDVALERVRNYSYPYLKLGASAYFADDLGGGAASIIDMIVSDPSRTYGDIAVSAPGYDAAAQRHFQHEDLAGDQVWIQKTSDQWLGTDYWYAFAGNPNASFADPGAPPPASSLDLRRLAGADRYATAAAVSAASFAPGVPVAYVATGANFPDALAGSAAAASKGGPMLLVSQSGIPSATASELSRLKPATIVVLGGPTVVGESVRAALAPYASTGVVRRLAGSNRYETAATISADVFAPGVPVAYVATGAKFPDALAGTPPAGNNGGPVLLVEQDRVPSAIAKELTRLRPGRIVILGGTSVVSSGVANALAGYTTGSVDRLAGSDRYATAAVISSNSFGSADTVYITTGTNFPDALSAGPVAGMEAAPMLLVPGTYLPDVVRSELVRLDPSTVVILGGTGTVSSSVASAIQALFP